MAYQIEEREQAVNDVTEAFNWYQSKQDGLGSKFLAALDEFYDRLIQHPETYSFYNMPVRQGKISRFPYVVVFEVQINIVIIYSVFMTSQNPLKKRTA